MAPLSSNKKIANSLVTASFGAVAVVYSAGYMRTQAAAEKFAAQISERRAPVVESAGILASVEIGSASPAQVTADANRFKETNGPAVIVPSARSTSARSGGGNEAVVPSPTSNITPTNVAVPATSQASEVIAPSTLDLKSEVTPQPTPVVAVAPPPPPPPSAPPAPARPKWKDGTYRGWGYSRHGDLEAEVVIQDGRIVSAVISDCRTRYSCSVIDALLPQVAKRQGPDVDNISGATQSADAFYGAVVEALGKAK